MPSNKIIQSLWIGGELSLLEQLCIKSFLQNGHIFHLYTYGKISNVPYGSILMDAGEIIPQEKIFLDSRQTYASFADWFRYKLLFDRGECWTDMDMICLKPIDIREDYWFSSQRDSDGSVDSVNIGFIKSPAKAEFLEEILFHIEQSIELDSNTIEWGRFGPLLFKAVLRNYDSKHFISASNAFCPIDWFETYRLISKQDIEFGKETYAVHFWNEIWRLGYLNKNAVYHPESVFEKLKLKYSVS